MANNVRIGTSIEDRVSGPLDRIRDKFDLMGKGAASASLVGNLGAMALAKGVSLVGNAVGFAVDKVGEAVDAYRTEQKSIAGLTAVLNSNIQVRKLSDAQIEKTIAGREKLAFADDEQREALKLLIAVTRDESRALDAQRVAMDLARFRNIDLMQASDLLGKALGGNTGALSRYGIKIKEGADATAILAEITRIAGGQAEKYAETDLGKVEAANIAVDNSMERIGETFSKVGAAVLPVVAEGFSILVDAAGALLSPFAAAADAIGGLIPKEEALVGSTLAMAKDMEAGVRSMQEAVEREAKKTADALAYQFETGGDRAKIALNDAMGSIVDRMQDTSAKITDSAKSIINDAYDPLINAAETRVTEIELKDAKQARSAKGLTGEEKAELDLRILNLQRHLAILKAESEGQQREAEEKAREHHANLLGAQTQYQLDAEAKAAVNQWGETWVNTAALGIAGGVDEVYSAGNQIVQTMGSFKPNGYPIGSAWVGGIASGIISGRTALTNAINRIRDQMYGQSPPKEGPLKDIDKGGANVARAWLDAFAGTLQNGRLDGPLSRLAAVAAGAPAAAQGGLSTAVAASASGGSQELHIYLDGREIEAAVSRQAHYRRGASGRFPG